MVRFDSRSNRYKRPFGAVREGEGVSFSLECARGLGAYHMRLVIFADDGSGMISVPMKFTALIGSWERYQGTVRLENPGLYWYRFEYDSPSGLVKIGLGSERKAALGQDASWQLTVFQRDFETPSFIKGGVMYQIFPDRFYRSPGYQPVMREDSHLREDWGGIPELIRESDGRVPNNDFFGGNLLGIEEKLDYLAGLGVNLIYLNPIFEAASNHKYDTGDYEKIDGVFGREESFRSLCAAGEMREIRIILDGVFNHTGADSRYFNKLGRYDSVGAYQSKDSPYYSWYSFSNWPDSYDSWWGVDILPQVREDNEDYAAYIAGAGGILEKWMDCGAWGYRLDVADELPDSFLDRIRSRIKGKNPESFLVGEVWEDASNKISYSQRRRYLQGRQLDSVMNYVFKDGIIGFLQGGSGVSLSETVERILENYPRPAADCLMNLLGTHDTARILTVLGSREKLRLAAVLQYFLPGLPCIFYGDEAGLMGGGDPFCRGCYPWGREDQELLEFYRKLGALRKEYREILGEGDYLTIFAREESYGFIRYSEKGLMAVLLNRGMDEEPVELDELIEKAFERAGRELCFFWEEAGGFWKNLMNGEAAQREPAEGAFSLAPLSFRLLAFSRSVPEKDHSLQLHE